MPLGLPIRLGLVKGPRGGEGAEQKLSPDWPRKWSADCGGGGCWLSLGSLG